MNRFHKAIFNLLCSLSALTFVGQSCFVKSPDLQHQQTLAKLLSSKNGPKDTGPSTIDIIIARGFVAELYSVPARDGAPMSIYHIINPLADQQTLNRYPVLVFHGITGDSSQLISHSEKQEARAPIAGQVTANENDTSLPFLLSNNNFDVYLIDARGSNLNNHLISTEFNPVESSKYWNFSLDEQIHYDLPAAIDFILEQSKEDKLHYIGYSESTLFMFALLASHPEYHSKLVSFVALAPISYVAHAQGTALTVYAAAAFLPDKINTNFVPQSISDTLLTVLRQVCSQNPFKNTYCLFLAHSVSGSGSNLAPPEFFSSSLKGTSVKAIKHFIQLYLSKRFRMYDYGKAGNLRQYGTEKVPAYDLSKVRLPTIILFRSDKDFLSTPRDQERLLRELGTKPYLDFVLPDYNHIEFIIGKKILSDIHLPAINAIFEIHNQFANRELVRPLDIFRDPSKFPLPRRYNPVVVQKPDGSRDLPIKSHFVANLMHGLLGPVASRIQNLETVIKLLKQPEIILKNLGQAHTNSSSSA